MEPNKEQNKFLIPLAIVAAGGMIAMAIFFGGGGSGAYVANTNNTANALENLPKITADDHIIGNPDAPIKIVEYSDIECPFCKIFHSTMQQIVRDYDGQVAWVYRHFPITKLHSKALKEAEATECAADQGDNTAFWNYLNKVLETTNSNDSLDLAELPKIAQAQGLDVEEFNECLSSGKHTDAIKKQVEDAVRIGARGTPYSVIIGPNGEKIAINGAENITSVKQKIDALLNK